MKKNVSVAGIVLFVFMSVVLQADAWTLSFFSEGFDVQKETTEHDPSVLLVIFGGDSEIEQVLKPKLEPLAEFKAGMDLHFDLAAYARSTIMFVPEGTLGTAVLQDTDFDREFTDAELAGLGLNYGTDPVEVGEGDLIVLLTEDHDFVKLGNVSQTEDYFVSFDFASIEAVAAVKPTPKPTPPAVSTPEPATIFLLGIGIFGILGLVRRKPLKNRTFKRLLCWLMISTTCSIIHAQQLHAETVKVYGTDVIFLAGQEDVEIPPASLRQPVSWPLLRYVADPGDNFLREMFPQMVPMQENTALSIQSSGYIHYGYGLASEEDPGIQPDGMDVIRIDGTTVKEEAKLGLTGYAGPAGALVGVFLDDSDPSTWDVVPGDGVGFEKDGEWVNTSFWVLYPNAHRLYTRAWNNEESARINFGSVQDNENGIGTGWIESHPAIGQIFYIGDGLTESESGEMQKFFVPSGATRLFLGVADAWGVYDFVGTEGIPEDDITTGNSSPQGPGYYTDNDGFFTVEVKVVSEPLFTVKKSGTGTGTVLIGEEECGPDCLEKTIPYTARTMALLKALPEPGSRFVRWETPNGNVVTKKMFANAGDEVVAVFEGIEEDKSFWLIGEWEFQHPEHGFRVKIAWNEEQQRFEGILTKLEPLLSCAGFAIDELAWSGTPTDQPGVVRENVEERWWLDIGNGQCLSLGLVEWKEGLVDVNRWPSRNHGIFDLGKDMIRVVP